jgi:hypothetical protein
VDTAAVAVNCGAPLYGVSGERKPHVIRYDREYGYRRRGQPLVGIFIGVIIILAGLGLLLSALYGVDNLGDQTYSSSLEFSFCCVCLWCAVAGGSLFFILMYGD